ERQLEQDSIAKKLAFIDWKVAAGQSIGDGYAPLALCDWEAQEVEEPQPALTISPASETWQAYDADESYKYEEDAEIWTDRISGSLEELLLGGPKESQLAAQCLAEWAETRCSIDLIAKEPTVET
ncbi:unnamed protein product, partial [Symbiodinium sp. KB8]